MNFETAQKAFYENITQLEAKGFGTWCVTERKALSLQLGLAVDYTGFMERGLNQI